MKGFDVDETWVAEHMAKIKGIIGGGVAPPMDDDLNPDDGPESKLQAKCLKYCKEHGYPVFHDFSRKKNVAGWPDLFIFCENRVVLVELKSATGKLRKEQKDLRQVLLWLGHTVHVVRSFVGFVRVMVGEV